MRSEPDFPQGRGPWMERGTVSAPRPASRCCPDSVVISSGSLLFSIALSHQPGDTPSLLPPRALGLSVPPAWISSSSRNPQGSLALVRPLVSPPSALRRLEPSLELPSARGRLGSAERPREGLQAAGKNNTQSRQHFYLLLLHPWYQFTSASQFFILPKGKSQTRLSD